MLDPPVAEATGVPSQSRLGLALQALTVRRRVLKTLQAGLVAHPGAHLDSSPIYSGAFEAPARESLIGGAPHWGGLEKD